ncbi:MAG TPA: RDD family protein [Thermoanaerobaculia bacterium]|nr:RDD family protein [Thermoanaerobaculia bacterium]
MICRNHVDVSEGVRRCSRCGSTFCRDCLVEIAGAPYCAMCKTEQLLDVRSGVSGPLDVAGIGRRFVALFLDGLVTGIPTLIIVFIWMGTMRQVGPRFFSPIFWVPTVASVIYQAAMLKARGQTLGKIAMKVKVVRPDGSDISGGQAWGREVSRAFLGLLYIVDYIPVFFTNDRRTIHDMLGGTRVVNWA